MSIEKAALEKALQDSIRFNTLFLPTTTSLESSILFHGTSANLMPLIQARGLAPRGRTNQATNWGDHPSNDKVVYLTSAYALHYANAASGHAKSELAAVIEVDAAKLKKKQFVGDEDSYALSAVAGFEWLEGLPLDKRVAYWRENIKNTLPDASLKTLGNCAYAGTIPPAAIKAVRLITGAERRTLMRTISDPVIAPQNFKIMGGMYQQFSSWMMGRETGLNEWFDSCCSLSLPLMSLEEAAKTVAKTS